jgi:hypothetical protein
MTIDRSMDQTPAVSTVAFPNPSLPSIPSFRIDVRGGWAAGPTPGALMAIVPSDPEAEGVHARIEWMRVPATTPLRDLAAGYLARLARRHRDVAVAVQKLGRVGDRPMYLRGTTMTDAATSTRVAQLQAFLLAPAASGQATADLFVLVGSCPEDDAPRRVPQFVELAASIAFTDSDLRSAPPTTSGTSGNAAPADDAAGTAARASTTGVGPRGVVDPFDPFGPSPTG